MAEDIGESTEKDDVTGEGRRESETEMRLTKRNNELIPEAKRSISKCLTEQQCRLCRMPTPIRITPTATTE